MEIIDDSYDSKSPKEGRINNTKADYKLKNININKSNNSTEISSDNEKTYIDIDNSKILKQKIDVEKQRYPYCIVWTPLPCISWFLPFIGHTGICG